jgi:hypothetical protein
VELPRHDAWSGHGIEVDAPIDATPPAATAEPNVAAAPAPVDATPVTAPRTAVARPVSTARPAKRAATAPAGGETPSGDVTSPQPAGTPPSGVAAQAEGASTAAAFGAAGLPAGVRHLPRAFARAVALANRGDKAWRTIPPGVVGEASVALPVEANGALGSLEFDDARERDRLLPVVRRMLDNTVLLLASGRFSLNARELSGGVMRVRLRVEILEQSAMADPEVDPNELNAIDYEPPQAGKPGHGAFLLNSGRRVICWVTPLG